MNRNTALHTRRQFLRTSSLGLAASLTVPVFLERTFFSLHAQAADAATQIRSGKDSPILVVLQLAGGNDGLNTLVPLGNDAYHSARPTLGLRAGSTIRLADGAALNSVLQPLMPTYEKGELAIVQGVGYPNPNRSHFRSAEIWETASDADKTLGQGWLGRYFDNCCKGGDPTVGVAVGGTAPQAFTAKEPTGVALTQPERYRWNAGRGEAADELEAFYRELNKPNADDAEGATIGMFQTGNVAGDNLDFIQRTGLDATISSDTIRELAARVPVGTGYPGGRLSESLSLVARLIGGGLPTRVYYVSQGGYDTHNNQAGTHNRLLTELGGSVAAFLEDLKKRGAYDRVLLMSFSEFGRRVAENGSGGTDHGAAAPLFLAGGPVRGGLHGKAPSLTELVDGDIAHTTDFRSVYATVLSQWLGAPAKAILGRDFPQLPLLRTAS